MKLFSAIAFTIIIAGAGCASQNQEISLRPPTVAPEKITTAESSDTEPSPAGVELPATAKPIAVVTEPTTKLVVEQRVSPPAKKSTELLAEKTEAPASVPKPPEPAKEKSTDAVVTKTEPTATPNQETVPIKEVTPATYTGTRLAGSSAPLLDFTKVDYDQALQSNKLVVLYFFASWCPICQAEFPKMQAAFNTLTTDQVIGFRVNYNDSATDENEVGLARAFGVAYQHTKVFLKNGERILKAPDSWDTERYISEIKKIVP